MIKSKAKRLGNIVLPKYSKDKELIMLPINLEGGNILPPEFKEYLPVVKQMISQSPVKSGIAYLTIHEKKVKKNNTQRRPGAHVDGNYIPVAKPAPYYGDTWGGDNDWNKSTSSPNWGSSYGTGWKVGDGGAKLTPLQHSESYLSDKGGLLITSSYPLCKGYLGTFETNPRQGGDCGHLDLSKSYEFTLDPNVVYLGNSQFVHESLPTSEDIERVLVRITLPKEVEVL